MPARLPLLLGALVLGIALCPACTPSSSRSSSVPDTAAVEPTADGPRDSSAAPSAPGAPAPADVNEGDRSVSQRLEDASVAARAKQALAGHRTLRRFEFAPSVVRGRLTLRGDVDTRAQYREAERVVAALGAVTSVTNRVTVNGRPVSDSEDGTASEATYHTVRRGDTLSEIARRYGVSVRQLRSLNDLSAALQPGDRVRVR